jgi:hypothetical protein
LFKTGVYTAISNALKEGVENIKHKNRSFNFTFSVPWERSRKHTINLAMNNTILWFVEGNAAVESNIEFNNPEKGIYNFT